MRSMNQGIDEVIQIKLTHLKDGRQQRHKRNPPYEGRIHIRRQLLPCFSMQLGLTVWKDCNLGKSLEIH